MRWGNRRRTLVDLIEAALDADPRDAPQVLIEADIFADDLARYTPSVEEPQRRPTVAP